MPNIIRVVITGCFIDRFLVLVELNPKITGRNAKIKQSATLLRIFEKSGVKKVLFSANSKDFILPKNITANAIIRNANTKMLTLESGFTPFDAP
ncbi:MAG: hypothetical protein WAV65_06965 [Ruminococcus bromii]